MGLAPASAGQEFTDSTSPVLMAPNRDRAFALTGGTLPGDLRKRFGKHARIGLMGAFDGEITLLVNEMRPHRRIDIATKTFHVGKLAGQRVVAVLSGVGLINAAHTAQILIDRFKVDAILFNGSAAPLNGDIAVLDTVLANSTQQFTMDFRPLFPLGEIPFQSVSIFPADPVLLGLARIASAGLAAGRTFEGKILSGDRLSPSPENVAILGGEAVESEGAAVGQVCHLNGVPYLVIRTMSNALGNTREFARYQEPAALRSQRITLDMLKLAH